MARWKEGKKPWDLQVSVQHSKMRFTLCDPGEEPYPAWKGFITILDWSIKKYVFNQRICTVNTSRWANPDENAF